MKIAVCLPSLNEAQNIQNITQIIDRGLDDFVVAYPDAQVEIINFDSNSFDNTAIIFLETKTNSPKRSIVIKDVLGKGKNILEFCKYVVKNNIDYCLTIDSDIVSATPDWVAKLLKPLIKDGAEYVTPVYERSRFEGSSTNHFAFPFIYAFTGNRICQPIAGDFAFTHKIASVILESDMATDEAVQRYGIDIFMSICAIGISNKISQVNLGKKLHAPSFSKLEYMFPQIAATALMSINSIKLPKQKTCTSETKSDILSSLQFAHRKTAQKMKLDALTKLKNEKMNLGCINLELIEEYIRVASAENIVEKAMTNVWTSVLASWANHYITPNLTSVMAGQAGEYLLPFFVLRATNFWFWAETVEVAKVEATIQKQAEILRDKLKAL